VFEKLLSKLISELLGKGLAAVQEYLNKRKVGKLQKQVLNLEAKVKMLEHEKSKTQKIQDWKYRLKNKEQESLAKELNKIRNKD
tara:strand:+ start:295 stop:546 length:252 start_codon:yes stop_codon:yes gene_type:complete